MLRSNSGYKKINKENAIRAKTKTLIDTCKQKN